MDVEKLVVECPLFRQIDPKDLAAMLKCLSAGSSPPSEGSLLKPPPGVSPSWVWCWRGLWR